MPKESFKIEDFHGGLNTNSDPRDIRDNESPDLRDIAIDAVGKLKLSGKFSAPSHGSNSNTLTLQNKNVVNLQGYGKSTYQNNEFIYSKSFRNKQEQQAGVGKTGIVNASKSLLALIGMSCTYAVNFYEENAYFIQKCKITEKQKEVLSNISKKKE